MNEHAAERHRPWIPAAIVLLLTSAALAATVLATTGTARTAAAAALVLLSPAAATFGACIVRRRYRDRIDRLESALDEERSARAARDRVYNEFTRELNGPLARISEVSRTGDAGRIRDLVQHLENLATAAQIDAGTYRPEFSVVRLDLHVTGVAASAAGSGLDITTDVRPATVWADPGAVRQILLNVLHVASRADATTARIDVEERNGLGIISLTDDRRDDAGPGSEGTSLLEADGSLPQRIVPALVAHQGATATTTRTLDRVNTVIRFPVATPAQQSASTADAQATPTPARTG